VLDHGPGGGEPSRVAGLGQDRRSPDYRHTGGWRSRGR
jgi:hypothetical protein